MTTSKTKKNNRRRYHKTIDQDQEPKMKSPIPLKLPKITLRRFLIMNLKLFISNSFIITPTTQPHFHIPKLLSSQTKCKLVTPSLILEPINASKSLRHGDIEDEVGHGEKRDGDPTVATLKTRWGWLCHEE